MCNSLLYSIGKENQKYVCYERYEQIVQCKQLPISKVKVVYQIRHFTQCVGKLVKGFHGDGSRWAAAGFLNQLLCLPQRPVLNHCKPFGGAQFWYTK